MLYLAHDFLVKKYIEQALIEDIGHGDITTNAIINQGQKLIAKINSREEGIICGVDVASRVFTLLDPYINIQILAKDGEKVCAGQDIAIIEGCARAVLAGERTALNFIQRMSAIATLTNEFQQAIIPYQAKISDTRKTTPNFRIFEKYAVKTGGGSPHRFGLFDCVMIKDNHIALAGGSLKKAVKLVKEKIGHTVKIEVETENMYQVEEALESGVDIIMLDNMTVEDMTESVILINKRAITEASGNISLQTVNNVASSGVDYISSSSIVAKAGTLDLGLDI